MKRNRMINGIALLIVGGLMFAVSAAFQPSFYFSYSGSEFIDIAFTILRTASIIAIVAGAAMLMIPAAVLVYYSLTGRKGR